MAPILRVANVSKRFGTVAAVDNVSLDIERGEFFALLGPSGCGKTTLLRMLAGFETPDAGEIVIDGMTMTESPPYARPVNMMFQSYALFPHMNVAANIAFGLRQDGMARAAIAARTEEMLALVEMTGLGERRPDQLSGGQRQRVALARALAKQPKILLLDEPLAALDRKLRERTRLELVQLQRRIGITFVVVTHDQEEAMSMAARLAVMESGRIRQIGPPREVYESPESRFVADFLGQVNLFAGTVRRRDGAHLVVFSADAGGELVVEDPRSLAPGAVVTVAVRPEKLALPPPACGAANTLAGRVADLSYVGDASVVHVTLASGTIVRVAIANAARAARPGLERGVEAVLSFAPDAAMVLTE